MERGGRKIGHHRLQLRLEPVAAERFAAEPRAADRPAPQRQMGPRIAKQRRPARPRSPAGSEDVRRSGAPAPRRPPGICMTLFSGNSVDSTPDRVVIDNGLQHEGVVTVEPVREPARLGPGVEPSRPIGQRLHMPVERATLHPKRRVVDEPVTDILVENLVEDSVGGVLARRNRHHAREPENQCQREPRPLEQGAHSETAELWRWCQGASHTGWANSHKARMIHHDADKPARGRFSWRGVASLDGATPRTPRGRYAGTPRAPLRVHGRALSRALGCDRGSNAVQVARRDEEQPRLQARDMRAPRARSGAGRPWQEPRCIRTALHPVHRRCGSVTCRLHAPSPRLGEPAHRRSRCDAGSCDGPLGSPPAPAWGSGRSPA